MILTGNVTIQERGENILIYLIKLVLNKIDNQITNI